MSQFLRIASGVNVVPLALELHRAPHLWGDYPIRQEYAGTPHAATKDIFVRFRPREEITGPQSHQDAGYRNAFWPAWRELPALRPIVFAMMAQVQGVELGSILITRLPSGGEILPHADRGVWAPEFYNCKCHLTVAGRSLSMCGGEEVTMLPGEVWTFDNLVEHSVKNPGTEDRIVVIVSMRVET